MPTIIVIHHFVSRYLTSVRFNTSSVLAKVSDHILESSCLCDVSAIFWFWSAIFWLLKCLSRFSNMVVWLGSYCNQRSFNSVIQTEVHWEFVAAYTDIHPYVVLGFLFFFKDCWEDSNKMSQLFMVYLAFRFVFEVCFSQVWSITSDSGCTLRASWQAFFSMENVFIFIPP